MNQTEIKAAVAQQEDYLLRSRSCSGVLGQPHSFRDFGRPSPDGTIAHAHTWRECLVCGASETDADYAARAEGRAQ